MMKSSILGSRLKSERSLRKWTLKEVAKKLGHENHTTYANWEYGTRRPKPDDLKTLADLYEVTTDYLTGTSDHRNPPRMDKINPDALILVEKINQLPPDQYKMIADLIDFYKNQKSQS